MAGQERLIFNIFFVGITLVALPNSIGKALKTNIEHIFKLIVLKLFVIDRLNIHCGNEVCGVQCLDRILDVLLS